MAPRLTFRPARPADIPAILAIERAVFSTDRLSPRALARFLQRPTAEVIAAIRGGALAGYGLLLYRANSRAARIYSVAVDPACQGQGIGAKLLAALERQAAERAERIRLEVRTDNDAAIGLYRRAGYTETGRIRHYYEDGHPALRLEKPLRPQPRG